MGCGPRPEGDGVNGANVQGPATSSSGVGERFMGNLVTGVIRIVTPPPYASSNLWVTGFKAVTPLPPQGYLVTTLAFGHVSSYARMSYVKHEILGPLYTTPWCTKGTILDDFFSQGWFKQKLVNLFN